MKVFCIVIIFFVAAAKVKAEDEVTSATTEDYDSTETTEHESGVILNRNDAINYAGGPTTCRNIKSKEEWRGRAATKVEYTKFPTEFVIIHHTDTLPCETESQCERQVRKIQNHHMDNLKLNDIGYNFLVGGDGNVYEGRGWHKRGFHTKGFNNQTLGIAFIGNFAETKPSSKQIQAAKDLLECGIALGELHRTYRLIGAKQVSSSSSPGAKLYLEVITWIHYIRNPYAQFGSIQLRSD